MLVVEVVSHCYAQELSHYAGLLCYQWSSFLLHKPKNCEVIATVCTCIEDDLTNSVVQWFMDKTPLRIRQIMMSKPSIGRRAIGRNQAALSTKADFVWFADVDQVYQDGCLDRLVSMKWPAEAVMIFPHTIKIHSDWAIGDQYVKGLAREPKILDINVSDFQDKTYHRAIGGVQIVCGDFARAHGYLDKHPKWQAQVEKPFGSFTDDRQYRGACVKYGSIVSVDLPGMYRLRHSTTSYKS